ncbi:MAG: 16S rRNA (cytosine(967)-C(5))-methyltransferase RsmB, partial [Deltaproteobacteria bacterium]|nr:16S rRNA (cytosine(967)-C(5))-methyltransferase RsmB [Deltaproteobacteria bacterium]
MSPDPRKIALTILNTLDGAQTTLDRAMDAATTKGVSLSRRDRALLNALVYGVLRWRERMDRIINHFSKTPFQKIDPPILNILRLGLFQIIYLDRIPLSAAVNTSVEMAKSKKKPWVAGFVNALLRNAARGHKAVLFPDPLKNPV